MRHFRNALVVVLFVGAVLFAPPRPAHACSCLQSTYEEDFARADAVFDGIADGPVADGNGVVYEFDVLNTEKGSVPDPASVKTPSNSAACGSNFDKDVAYRVFVRKEGGTLSTNLCMGNIKTTDAPKITPTTIPPKATTTAPAAPDATVPDATTTSESTTTSALDGDSVAIDQSDDGSGWALPAALAGVALAGAAGVAWYVRSRRTGTPL